jgi:dihydrofolate reductase
MTSRTLYSATMSLDGYISGPGGDQSWMRPFMGPNPLAEEIMRQTGSLLTGAGTWFGDDPNRGTDKEGAFEGAWSGPQFVLTHRPPPDPVPDVTFMDDLPAAVTAAREAAGDRYVNILGADVARQCFDAGLVDEVLVMVAPVLLGDGTRLFEWPGGHQVDLVSRPTVDAAGVTSLWYDVG